MQVVGDIKQFSLAVLLQCACDSSIMVGLMDRPVHAYDVDTTVFRICTIELKICARSKIVPLIYIMNIVF